MVESSELRIKNILDLIIFVNFAIFPDFISAFETRNPILAKSIVKLSLWN